MDGFLRTSLLALCFSHVCLAVDPAHPLGALRFSRWDQQNGLLQDSMNAIAQTPDGFLWVASDEGLVRFDGADFSVPDEFEGTVRDLRRSNCLWPDSGGRLWIGSHGGAYCRTQKGDFEYYDQHSGLPASKPVSAIAADAEGTVWIGTDRAGLFRKNADQFVEYAPAQELRGQRINRILGTKSGAVWVAASAGLYQIDQSLGSVQRLDTSSGLGPGPVTALSVDPLGRLWVATNDWLAYFDHDTFYPIHLPSDDKSGISALFTDSHGMLWIGSRKGGIWRISAGANIGEAEFQSLSSVIGSRRSPWISAFCEDIEGDIWVGSNAGLVRISDTRFKVYTSKEGLPTDSVWAVLAGRSGKIWIGTDAGLAYLPGQTSTQATLPPPVSSLLSGRIRTLCEDSRNILWVGTFNGSLQQFHQEPFSAAGELMQFSPAVLVSAICEVPPDEVWVGTVGAGLHRFRNGKLIQSFTEKDGIIHDAVPAMALGQDGTLWVAPAHGLLMWRHGRFEDALPKESQIRDFVFRSLIVSSQGQVWAGSFESGLSRIGQGSAKGRTVADGLFTNEFYTLREDGRGNLWASSNRGIFATKITELNAFFDGQRPKLNCRVFTAADGLLTPECNGGPANTSSRSADGRLWFATMGGVAVTSTEALSTDSRSPPIVLEKVIANLTRSISISPDQVPITLSPDIHSIELHYAGLSLAASENLRYRYKLEGFDPAWVEAGTRRAAYYTNLPPGDYRFRVAVQNRDGVWSTGGLVTRFILRPHFYQTWWFYTLCACLVALAVWGMYCWRVRQILKERARIAHDLHDSLAQSLTDILAQTQSAIKSEQEGLSVETTQTLERVKALARETLLDVRNALRALRTSIHSDSTWLTNAIARVIKKRR